MPNQAFQTLTMTDDAVVRAFTAMWNELGSSNDASYSFDFMDDVGGFSGPMPALSSQAALMEHVSRGLATFRSASLNVPSANGSVQILRSANGTDTVTINLARTTEATRAALFVAAVRQQFREFDRANQDGVLGAPLADFYRSQAAVLDELRQTALRVVEQTATYRQQLDVQRDVERAAFETEMVTARQKFAYEQDEQRVALGAREGALNAREQTLDDRSSTHARRKLREDLKTIIADRSKSFSLTPETQKKRRPIEILFVVLIGATLAIAIFSAVELPAAMTIFNLVRFTASAVSAVGALAFYIRWHDRWARAHADEEFRLKRLELDIDRASWVVEMALEFRTESGGQLPSELIERLTRNLFSDDGATAAVRHPAEDLFSLLLGTSAGIKFGPNGAEVTYDRKGLQKALDAKGEK